MKISYIIILFTIFYLPARSQYFYNDLLTTQNNRHHFSLLQKEKIKKVTVKAFDSQGEEIEDFVLYQEVNADKRTLTTFSNTNLSDASIMITRYNEQHIPVEVMDSSEGATTLTKYFYDAAGRMITMQSRAIQAEQKENVVTEERQYIYNTNGQPETMIRIKGGTDTLQVKFKTPEKGLPEEEEWWKDGRKIETWFYYYDSNNRLTDIVRYNEATQQMLPDYLFGYDNAGNLSSKVTVMQGTLQYRIWQYAYNEQGLKVQETVMNKQRIQEGKLVYSYQ